MAGIIRRKSSFVFNFFTFKQVSTAEKMRHDCNYQVGEYFIALTSTSFKYIQVECLKLIKINCKLILVSSLDNSFGRNLNESVEINLFF